MNEHMCVYIYEWPPENSVCGYWALDNGLILVLGIANQKQASRCQDETKQASYWEPPKLSKQKLSYNY